MRRGEAETVRVALEWISQGKRHKGKSKKIWIYMVEEDLKTFEGEDWRKTIKDRERLRRVVIVVKTIGK